MKKFYLTYSFWSLIIFLCITYQAEAQFNFTRTAVNLNGHIPESGYTSMAFGPDGRLYASEYDGSIWVYTIQRNATTGIYSVLAAEELNHIQQIQNHNDDGTLDSGTLRELLGISVAGTSANPIIYAVSSDFRWGGFGNNLGGDSNLDTNSGILTQLRWNGSSWNAIDLVRGLPRSEENHGPNSIEYTVINGTEYLIVAQGGNTNGGAPSVNFAFTCEYVLTAALLAINLDMLQAMPVLNDNGRNYVYDLPTLDDPTRPNLNSITDPDVSGYNGIDIGDPWGGNDGLNMAILDPDGPVQIFASGLRNIYDFVITQQGALYYTDNGANQGWGGFPENEGGPSVTNNYDTTEPGSSSASGGEFINNVDHLGMVSNNIETYTFGTHYGGHPNPIRANPEGAGLYTNSFATAQSIGTFRTLVYDPDGSRPNSTTDPNLGLPANWPPMPVTQANPVEGDWRGPGIANPDGPLDDMVTVWGTNTNAIDEYTASNFDGALQGNLFAGVNTRDIRRVELNPDGSLATLTPSFLTINGGNPLGLVCNGDEDPFPGTIWVGHLNGGMYVFEPQDFTPCLNPGDPGFDANADYDGDGYTNQDEIDNGTNICNGGSVPSDFDLSAGGILDSDLNDNDDDNDGIPDSQDPFQLGNPNTAGSDAFVIPVDNSLFSDTSLGGYLGLGVTGMMNNGAPNPNWINWLDRRDDPNDPHPNDILGGAIGAMTMQMTGGSAYGAGNNQEKGFQYGVQVDQNTGVFTVSGSIVNFNAPTQLYGNSATPDAELGIFIGDGTQSNYIQFVLTKQGISAMQEIADSPQPPLLHSISAGNRPNSEVVFYFIIDPASGMVTLEYSFDGNSNVSLGNLTAQGAILNALQQSAADLAVGMIGSSKLPGQEVEGTWHFLNVDGNTPMVRTPLLHVNSGGPAYNFNGTAWSADQSFSGGSIYSNNVAIANTINDQLFITERYSSTGSLVYNIPVSNGLYDLELYFAEIYFGVSGTGGVGSRVFNISVENGQGQRNNYDIIAAAGGSATAVAEQFPNINVTDGTLTFTLTAVVENPKISGFEIFSKSNSSTENPVVDAGDDQDVTLPTTSIILNGAASDPDGGTIQSYLWSQTSGPSAAILNNEDTPNLTAQDLIEGTYVFRLTATDDESETGFDEVVVNVMPSTGAQDPEAFAGLDKEIALPETSVLILGTGNDPDGGTISSYSWNQVSGPNTATLTGGTTSDLTASNLVLGTYIFRLTVTDDESSTAFDDVEVVVSPVGWTDKDDVENYDGRHECAFLQVGDKFYLVGGRESTAIDVYDYSTNTWSTLASPAPVLFSHFQGVVYGGMIWVIGAIRDNFYPVDVPEENIWIFDPVTEEWIEGPEIPIDRQRGATGLAVYNDKFYIVSGSTNAHDGGYVPWFDEYDPLTGTWTALQDAPNSRDHFQVAVIGDKLYSLGGRLSGGPGGIFQPYVPEVDVFDFLTMTWTTLPASLNLPTPRASAQVTVVDDKLWVLGGSVEDQVVDGQMTTGVLSIVEEFEPVTQVWRRLPNTEYIRRATQAIVSGDGVYMAAGSNTLSGGFQNNLEYYGQDNPEGSALSASVLTAPDGIDIPAGSSSEVNLSTTDGNVGVYIRSMEITGPDATNFNIVSGQIVNGFFNPNSIHAVTVAHNGANEADNASLIINYGASSSLQIQLSTGQNQTSFWLEDFEDLTTGTTVDNGATAWSSSRDGGIFEVTNGVFRVNGGSTQPGIWTSEVISINGITSISMDVDDINDLKEGSDFLNAFYVVDGGSPVLFGSVSDDITPQSFTATDIVGNTIQIIVESQVSANNETYIFDNVLVNNTSAGGTDYNLTVVNGSGDGLYEAGSQPTIVADAPPPGEEFDSWTGDISTVADVNSASTTLSMPAADVTVTATYSAIAPGSFWLEDFEDLTTGTTVDNGATAWSSSRDGGIFEVTNGVFRVNGGSTQPGIWASEVISINGITSISMDVDDINDLKEGSDFLNAFYVVDGGSPVLFGSVSDDITPQSFTATDIVGNTIQIIVESQVSANNETYIFDNITVTEVQSSALKAHITATQGGIKQASDLNAINLYPNPTTDYSNIIIKKEPIAITHVLVFDITGRLVKQMNIKEKSINPDQIQVGDLEEGLYFIKFLTKDTQVYYNSLVVKKR